MREEILRKLSDTLGFTLDERERIGLARRNAQLGEQIRADQRKNVFSNLAGQFVRFLQAEVEDDPEEGSGHPAPPRLAHTADSELAPRSAAPLEPVPGDPLTISGTRGAPPCGLVPGAALPENSATFGTLRSSGAPSGAPSPSLLQRESSEAMRGLPCPGVAPDARGRGDTPGPSAQEHGHIPDPVVAVPLPSTPKGARISLWEAGAAPPPPPLAGVSFFSAGAVEPSVLPPPPAASFEVAGA